MRPGTDVPTGFFESFRYAGAGLLYTIRTQRNFRVHLVVTVFVLILAIWLNLSCERLAILVLTISMVLTAEIFNTAAESLVDLTSPGYHPLAKRVKDLAAGAVLLAAFVSIIVGLLLLGPPLLSKLSQMLV